MRMRNMKLLIADRHRSKDLHLRHVEIHLILLVSFLNHFVLELDYRRLKSLILSLSCSSKVHEKVSFLFYKFHLSIKLGITFLDFSYSLRQFQSFIPKPTDCLLQVSHSFILLHVQIEITGLFLAMHDFNLNFKHVLLIGGQKICFMSLDDALVHLIQSFYYALNLKVGAGNGLSILENLQEVLSPFF